MTQSAAMKACLILCAIVVCISGVQAALTVNAGPDQTVNTSEPVTVHAVYNDTVATDLGNRSATINWTVTGLPGTITADDGYNGTVTGTYMFSAAGTYAVTVNVTNSNASTSGSDTLLVTVNETVNGTVPAMPIGTTKIVPRTLNAKSNGILTVFLTLGNGWANVTNGSFGRSSLSPEMVTFLGAMPVRINFCMKDGGTFILKFRRQDLQLEGVQDKLTVTGNITTENGNIPFTGSDSVRVKHADAGSTNIKTVDKEDDNGEKNEVKNLKNDNGHGKK